MLEAIGHLQALEELQVWCSTIPVGVLAETLRHAHRLRKIYFFRVDLAGTQEDMDRLGAAMADHLSLREIRFGGFTVVHPTATLDGFLKGMKSAPKLETVNLQLTGYNAAAPFSGEALAIMLQSTSIVNLYMSRLGLGSDHVAVIALALVLHNRLQVLDLFGNVLENEHIMLMANALAGNASLETLVLRCPANDLSINSCVSIARALRSNSTLVTLNLPRSSLNDDALTHLMEGLTVNRTLKKIEVGVHKDVGDSGLEALTQMLEKNYDLERLVVSTSHKSVQEKVDYYRRLNEVGRGSLLRDDGKATREQWVDMLVSVKDDLDCLFYFVSTNPAICQFANAANAPVIITEVLKTQRRHTINNAAYAEGGRPIENRRASAV